MDSAEEETRKQRLIIVAMDESEESIRALQWALRNICAAQDRLMILHAQRPASHYMKAGGPAYSLPTDMVRIFELDIKRAAEKIFKRATEMCKNKEVVLETKAVTGDARQVICEAVKRYNPDILVLGSHGYGPLKRAFLGSVSDHCVHHVQCPVLVVKSGKSNGRNSGGAQNGSIILK
uniref:TSA: Wollemia nobilis Ref_Wollemi_Transcript_13953_1080 transcribed RNA sequence n=1 Tax=Wollemia nobilis TaxID=56998 RepID=A0A0C9RTC1_9CONI